MSDVEFGGINVILEFPEISQDLHLTASIHIDLEFIEGIQFFIEFELTHRELMFINDMVGNKAEGRLAQIARYHFYHHNSLREIATHLGISKSVVGAELDKYKKKVLQDIKSDLRLNKKILGHMVDLMCQIEFRVQELSKQYQTLSDETAMLRQAFRNEFSQQNEIRRRQIEAEKRAKNPDDTTPVPAIPLTSSQLMDILKISMTAHDKKVMYMNQLRLETQTLYDMWDKFGLCGEEAMKLILEGGIDIEAKVEETKTFLVRTVHILKEELKDESKQHKIFTRLINEVKDSGIYGKAIRTTALPS